MYVEVQKLRRLETFPQNRAYVKLIYHSTTRQSFTSPGMWHWVLRQVASDVSEDYCRKDVDN